MSSPEPSAPAAPAPKRRWPLAIALLALFAGALALFTQHNRYPFFYHPDEYGKAKQIVDRKRNFNHPLLLLNVAQPIKKLSGKGPDPSKAGQLQVAVEAGRTASAIFAAVTVVALVVAGYLLAGPGGALGAGAVVLFHPLLFEHAHIFKEDTAVVMGLALSCMAAALFAKAPHSRNRTILLGVATALAVSGKYVGALALAITLPVIIFAPGEGRTRRLRIFAAAYFVTFLFANRQMFTHLGEWWESFDRELTYSVKGHRGLIAQDPVSYYQYWFGLTVPLVAVVLLGLNALHLLTTARRRVLAEWLIFLFPFAFTGMLMLSPRTSDRYFLPAALLFNFNAMVGLGLTAEWFTRAFGKFKVIGQLLLVAVALYFGWRGQFAKFQETAAQFKVDDRRDLEAWINANLPAGSQIAQDSTVGLPDPTHHKQKGLQRAFPHTVLGSEFVPDLGTLDELRAKGVRYIVSSPKKSQRYTGGAMAPSDEVKEEFERRKTFYSALPQQGKVLFKRDQLEIDTLHPGLELYDLGAQQ